MRSPQGSILMYELPIKTNTFLLVVQGAGDEVLRAKIIPQATRLSKLDMHSSHPVKRATSVQFLGALDCNPDFSSSWEARCVMLVTECRTKFREYSCVFHIGPHTRIRE